LAEYFADTVTMKMADLSPTGILIFRFSFLLLVRIFSGVMRGARARVDSPAHVTLLPSSLPTVVTHAGCRRLMLQASEQQEELQSRSYVRAVVVPVTFSLFSSV